jgi:hypothetical protein
MIFWATYRAGWKEDSAFFNMLGGETIWEDRQSQQALHFVWNEMARSQWSKQRTDRFTQ